MTYNKKETGHSSPTTTQRPKKHLDDLRDFRANILWTGETTFLEGVCPAASGVKVTRHFIKPAKEAAALIH